MKEKIRIFVCNKCCNTAYTTDVSIPGACTSQYWVRTSGICGGHYSEIEGAERAVLSMTTPHFDWVVNQEVEKRIKERMPSEEEWIDIKDRMPESGQCVLIYSHSGGVAEGAWLSSKNHFEQWRWSAVLNDVTHWFIDVFLNNSEKYHNKIDKK